MFALRPEAYSSDARDLAALSTIDEAGLDFDDFPTTNTFTSITACATSPFGTVYMDDLVCDVLPTRH